MQGKTKKDDQDIKKKKKYHSHRDAVKYENRKKYDKRFYALCYNISEIYQV